MAKKKAATKAAKKTGPEAEPSFEQSLGRLHEIVATLEGGEVSLEESLARYEEGMTLLRSCHQRLTTAEQRIQKLTGFDSDGDPETAPFDGTATADQVQGAGRRQSGDAATLFE